MCTVTYIPVSKTEFFLTSNRDKQTIRAEALPPKRYRINDISVYYPKDPQAGGTWIAVSEKNYTLCLLNGAFQKHQSKPPYRMSRGQVVLDFFKYNDAVAFSRQYDFKGIEPFTLLIICTTDEICFYELRWDGEKAHLAHVDEDKPHIWSSVTLYPHEVIAERQLWFGAFINDNIEVTKENIIHFHQFGGNGNTENDLQMNRNNRVRTVSITMVNRTETNLSINYINTLTQKNENIRVIK